jgi:subtilisin family serine protease
VRAGDLRAGERGEGEVFAIAAWRSLAKVARTPDQPFSGGEDMKRNLLWIVSLIVGLVVVALMPARAQQEAATQILGPRDTPKFRRLGSLAIRNHYIVVLEDGVSAPADFVVTATKAHELMAVSGGETTNVFAHALNGFSARMSEAQALRLSLDPRVKFVEEDSIMTAVVTQTNPPSWGLDRIGQRDLPLNNTYSFTTTGVPVNAYVIDTGIRRTHTQFGGRAVVGFDAIGDGQNTNDCNGHGTHVSGTIGDRRLASPRPCGCSRFAC